MTKLGSWKRAAVATAVAVPVAAGVFGGVALAERHSAGVPAQGVKVGSQRSAAPEVQTPVAVRREATTYRVSGDECVGSVCAGGIAATTPAVEVDRVGGNVATPEAEVATGTINTSVWVTDDAIGASVYYGAIGVSYEVIGTSLPEL